MENYNSFLWSIKNWNEVTVSITIRPVKGRNGISDFGKSVDQDIKTWNIFPMI